MPLSAKRINFSSEIAARRNRISGSEGKRALPPQECTRVIHGLRLAINHDSDLYGYIAQNLMAFYDPLSSVATTVNLRLGRLEKQHSAKSSPVWQVGEYGARLVRQLCYRRENECAQAGLALELGYAYLEGLLPVKAWMDMLSLLDRFDHPLVIDGLETKLSRRYDIQPDRPILMPTGIGTSVERYRIDPELYRTAIFLVQDWQRGCLSPAPRSVS